MAALTTPLRVCRGILKEIRAVKGQEYKQTLAYNYVLDQFRKNQVSSERYCRAQEEALHTSTPTCASSPLPGSTLPSTKCTMGKGAQARGGGRIGGTQTAHSARRERMGEVNQGRQMM